jgi:hypothetical protein
MAAAMASTVPPIAPPMPAPSLPVAELGFLTSGGADEVALARVIGHHDIDVVGRVATFVDRAVRIFRARTVRKQPSDKTASI